MRICVVFLALGSLTAGQLADTIFGDALGPRAAYAQSAEESPVDILAAQIRKQGHVCDKPQSAERDPSNSKPDEAGWILRCGNATYSIRLIPDQSAIVKLLQ
jgi:hypothetical protein